MKKLFVGLIAIAGILLVGEILWSAFYLFAPNSSDPSYKIILIEPGPLPKTVEFLHKEGLVSDSKRFLLMMRIFRQGNRVRVGEYEVRMNVSPFGLMRILTSGKSVLHAMSIPEGYNIDQIADALAAKRLVNRQEFVKMARDPQMARLLGINEKTLEGYLYPETYSFTHFTGEHVILKTMVEKFKEVYNRDIKFAADKIGMSMHDIVTMACIIEKETGAPEERPIISSVFHNRLKIRMPLQSDPTVIYGKKGDKKNISRKDLTTPSPYNTYNQRGLPVGTISNPGRSALLATLEPADTNYLYFVSRNDGTHYFSSTYAEHAAMVRKFQIDPKAREGRSWRDRLKKDRNTATQPNK